MISLIVCSVNKVFADRLKQNVDATIGVEHQWLIYENKNKRGLCEVYNELAEAAVHPYLCFLHEDITIKTAGWGNVLIGALNTENAALAGVAGGKYKSHLYSGWYSGGEDLDYYRITHVNGDIEEPLHNPSEWLNAEEKVATIDGVLMFCRKDVWNQVRFNDRLLSGFHLYDIDFSLRVSQLHKVIVTNKLEIVHYTTGGDYTDNWVMETIRFHESVKHLLPFSVTQNVPADVDLTVAKYWLDWLKDKKISAGNRRKWVYRQQLYKYPALWYGIVKFLLYRPLHMRRLHTYIKRKNFLS